MKKDYFPKMKTRPVRDSAKAAMDKIKDVHNWENCREDSELFKKVADKFEKEFEAEDMCSGKKVAKVTENGVEVAEEYDNCLQRNSDVSEYESEEEDESEDYESSFVDDESEDDYASSGEGEWLPKKKQKYGF